MAEIGQTSYQSHQINSFEQRRTDQGTVGQGWTVFGYGSMGRKVLGLNHQRDTLSARVYESEPRAPVKAGDPAGREHGRAVTLLGGFSDVLDRSFIRFPPLGESVSN